MLPTKTLDLNILFNQLKSTDINVYNRAMNTQLTKNFKLKEFLVYRTRAQIRQYFTLTHLENTFRLALQVQEIRTRLGRSIRITSGWRDIVTNRRVGGATNSLHLTGEAVDFVVQGLTPKQVQNWLHPWWTGGLGYGTTFTHLDIRPYYARFGYG